MPEAEIMYVPFGTRHTPPPEVVRPVVVLVSPPATASSAVTPIVFANVGLAIEQLCYFRKRSTTGAL